MSSADPNVNENVLNASLNNILRENVIIKKNNNTLKKKNKEQKVYYENLL